MNMDAVIKSAPSYSTKCLGTGCIVSPFRDAPKTYLGPGASHKALKKLRSAKSRFADEAGLVWREQEDDERILGDTGRP